MTSPLVQAMAFQNAVHPAQTGIAPTDVVGSYKLASDVAEKNYQAQLAKQQALWGGLAGLGSAGILAFAPSALKKLSGLGTATAAAPTNAATAVNAAANSGITTGDLAAGVPQGALASLDSGAAAAPAALGGDAVSAADIPALTGMLAPTASGTTLGWPMAGAGSSSLAGDFGFGNAAADAAGGTVATDFASAAPAATLGADAAASTLPDWLASALPFLFAA